MIEHTFVEEKKIILYRFFDCIDVCFFDVLFCV
jgi:hypothetical protein